MACSCHTKCSCQGSVGLGAICSSDLHTRRRIHSRRRTPDMRGWEDHLVPGEKSEAYVQPAGESSVVLTDHSPHHSQSSPGRAIALGLRSSRPSLEHQRGYPWTLGDHPSPSRCCWFSYRTSSTLPSLDHRPPSTEDTLECSRSELPGTDLDTRCRCPTHSSRFRSDSATNSHVRRSSRISTARGLLGSARTTLPRTSMVPRSS
mmetsp:Transcript_111779/g.193992  ORF Transcript_111779/g.193992 Transcript_111779/m.193992 type:complete len:204 (-) Transcript_111779:204-815(-)